MRIVPLMLIAVIILLTSLPAPIKVTGRGSGGLFAGSGSGFIAGGSGFQGSGSGYTGGYKGGGSGSGYSSGYRGGDVGGGGVRPPAVGTGYKGANEKGKPAGGGDPGAAIVVFPKKPPETTKVPMPQACKQEVRNCINTHIYGSAGEPKHRGSCCVKLKNSVPCVCKFLTSQDPKLSNAANGVLRGCHYRKPDCPKMPMPQECREDVKACINTHIYGAAGEPKHRGSCCLKLKHSKKCVCRFLTSQDSRLSKAANGVLRGCHFRKASCPKI